ncbi:mRNA turnover protein 4 [Thraustotheca clavata]|uniref:Ribosome assembly factor mrt4 n=1 Tax=Thraustotheca clavata TaxID=74557 RepID=A0A1W0A1Q6_9STRA|nr:mRNA turnover protein 4 [Thraustotheca clavata]
MPKSRRVRAKPLTQTNKKGAELKKGVVESIRSGIDEYDAVYVFSFENMRTNHFKVVRTDFNDSRFFLGKNKVMKVALGRSPEEEYASNLFKVAHDISGSVGLLMTNKPDAEVREYFNKLSVQDYAKSGFVATETVTIPAGPLPQFVGSMVESLRALGLPVDLKRGVITLNNDYTICKEGATLTPEQAKLLVHFDNKMSYFSVQMLSRWTKDGKYERIAERKNKNTQDNEDEDADMSD